MNNRNIKPISPFILFCQKVIPLAFDESMSYYECLCALTNYLYNEVIPAVNNNADAVTELQTYVANYFKNLDVQEEINNKLDEMAESGQLADIVAQYLNLAGVLGYNTVNDMINASNLVNGSFARTYGLNTYNDGKGAFYKIRTITSSDVVDGINIIAVNFSETLIAEKMPDYYIQALETQTNLLTNKMNLLTNKKYIFIGDSYLEGYTPNGIIENWGIKVANILGLSNSQYIINAYGGSGFVRTDTKTFTQMINELTSDNDVTDVVVCGGYNDIGAPENTLLEFMTTFKTACNTKFPNAKIHVGHIGWTTNPSNIFSLCVNVGHYKKLSAKLGFNYLTNVEYILKDYFSMFTSDSVHPNNVGQEALAYNIVSALIGGSANVQYDFKNIGLSPAHSDWQLQTNGNFGASVNNGLTSLYCESIINFGLGQDVLNLSCDNQAYELADITDGYVIGTTYGSVSIPVTCVIGYSGGYATVTGKILINNKKLYLSLYSTNTYTDANAFGSLPGTYLIQIMASNVGVNSLMC